MKQCIKCGSWIEDEANFCNVCGMRQDKVYVAPVWNQGAGQQPFAGENNVRSPYGNPYGNELPKSNSGLGIAGFVLGIIGLLFSCCGGIGVIVSVIGMILSIVAMVKYNPVIHQNRGLVIAGLILNGIALLFSLIVIPFWGIFWEEFFHELQFFYL